MLKVTNMSLDSKENWFAIEKDTYDTHDTHDTRWHKIDERMKECEKRIADLEKENLRLVNRILEAEIAAERYKNLMLRKNISFPFSPMLSAKLHPHTLEM